MSIYSAVHDPAVMEQPVSQCVSAQEIAQAFMDLMHADQESFLLLLAIAVFILSAPALLNRLFDYLESRKAHG